MSTIESIGIACFLMVVVFFVLFCLCFCIKIFSVALNKLENAVNKKNASIGVIKN